MKHLLAFQRLLTHGLLLLGVLSGAATFGVQISGSVIGEDGQAIAGAEVRVVALESEYERALRGFRLEKAPTLVAARSGTDGGFVLFG